MPDFHSNEDAPPIPPVRPSNDECCRSGCEPCVFDLYEQAMERYYVVGMRKHCEGNDMVAPVRLEDIVRT